MDDDPIDDPTDNMVMPPPMLFQRDQNERMLALASRTLHPSFVH